MRCGDVNEVKTERRERIGEEKENRGVRGSDDVETERRRGTTRGCSANSERVSMPQVRK